MSSKNEITIGGSVAATDSLEEAIFSLEDFQLRAINGAAAKLLADVAGERCHEVFCGETSPCKECKLGELTDGASMECPTRPDHLPKIRAQVFESQGANVVVASHRPDRESSQFLSEVRLTMLENTGSGMMLTDAKGEIIYANVFAETVLCQKLRGKQLGDVLPGIERTPVSKAMTLLVAPEERDIMIGYRCTDSTVEGEKATVVTFRDVTEVERMRTDMQRMERLSEAGRMMSVMAHEMRNPLAGIKATAQSLEFGLEADETLCYSVRQISQEVDRLEALLKEYLTFGRHRLPKRSNTEIGWLFEAVVNSTKHRFDDHVLEIDGEEVGEAWIDAHQLQQVLINLLLNAADATPAGGKITLRATMSEGNLCLEVADTGTGMRQDQKEQAFNAFFTTKGHGTGLGLTVCFRVVKDHGGTLEIETEMGRGTTMMIRLPYCEPRN